MMNALVDPNNTVHKLKTVPSAFEAVWSGRKNFEFRKNDRNFKVGDVLQLEEFNPATGEYSGRAIKTEVIYLLEGRFGVPMGFCVMSISSAWTMRSMTRFT